MALDLEAIWQEHRPFIVSVVAGAIVYSGLSLARASVQQDCDRLARANAGAHEKIVQDLASLEGKEGIEKGRREGLQKAHEAVLSALAWEPEKAFELPAGEKNLSIFVTGACSQAADTIARLGDREKVRTPRNAQECGLDGSDLKDDAPKAKEILARADVTKRVVMAAIESGATRIGSVKQAEARYLEQPERDGKPCWLRMLPVAVSFEGDARAVARVLDKFEEKGRFLEVVRARTSRSKEGQDVGRLDVDLELAQISLVDAIPADMKDGGKKTGGDEGPRRPRPRRGER